MHISYLLQTSSLDLSTRTRVYDERVSKTHLNLGLHYRDLTWVFKKRSSTLSARCPEKKGIGRLWELRTIHTYPIPGPYIYIAQNSHKLSRLINQECLEYIKIARCSKKKKKGSREYVWEWTRTHPIIDPMRFLQAISLDWPPRGSTLAPIVPTLQNYQRVTISKIG